ncbi:MULTISPECIES: hypothetical protein [unclassified Gilliamella]|jgi:hypothetical protein|uniref:hypothetical protein n=1 Tax=unclassified Gilliamella TaxID=2685620 RepID=UPI00080DF35C|nr:MULTISPECIES: hypothetical protein [Gilliamella]NUF50327.1 hypothetical protein [Gilliamella sp. ESL0250]OCG14761.1 hypothetical protein A9G47_13260 [Gilliamella apicola]OCG18402.1 hypothetical protein A9G47_05525 [Gilliamella apicola]
MSKQPIHNSLTYILSDDDFERIQDNIDFLRLIVDCAGSQGTRKDITINTNAFCTSLGKIEDNLRNIINNLVKTKTA